MKGNRIDVIVNCAAFIRRWTRRRTIRNFDKLNHDVALAIRAAAEACGTALIQVSTDYVFDGTGHTPYTEEAATCPNSVYGSTKLAGEQAVMKHCSQRQIIRTQHGSISIDGLIFVKTMPVWGVSERRWGCLRPDRYADICQMTARVIFCGCQIGDCSGIIISATRVCARGMISLWLSIAWPA